jgi:hypothetical protein
MAFQTYKAISIYLISPEIDGVFNLHGPATKIPYLQNYIVGIFPLLGHPAISGFSVKDTVVTAVGT